MINSEPAAVFRGDIVLKPSVKALRALLLIGVVSLAYGLYLKVSGDSEFAIVENGWEAVAFGGLCVILAISGRWQRIVVSRDYTTKYWGTKIRRQCSNRGLVAIRTATLGVSTLVFDGGAKIRIPSNWPGQAQVLQVFRTILDARVGNLSNRDEWIPLTYLTFPPRCVSCRASDVGPQRVHAGWVIAAGHARLDRRVSFNLPVCRACAGRRRRGLVRYWILASALGVGIVVSWFAIRDSSFLDVMVVALTFLVFFNVTINFLPRWANRRFLGIEPAKLKSDKTAVRIWFRDQQLEMEVRLLTEEYRSKSLAGAREFLGR